MTRLLLFFCALSIGAQTVTLSDSSVLQLNPYKIGINIGSVSFYGSGQVYKNLLAETNAGFEALQLQQIWVQTTAGTTTTFTAPDIYPAVAANRFAGATYTIVESATAAKGCTGTITGNTAGAYPNAVVYTLGTPCAAATSVGDTMLVRLKEFPTAEATWEAGNTTNGTWGTISGGGKLTTDSTTPYDGQQSLVLDTTAGGKSQMTLYFDSETDNRFVNFNGTYTMSFAAKLLSGSAQSVSYTFSRGSLYCSFNATPTSSWAVYTGTCTASETASTAPALAGVTVAMNATGGQIEIDDLSLVKTSGADSTNTTVFRDEVVNTIKAYCGGVTGQRCPIRNWLNQNGENLDNWILSADWNDLQTTAGDGSALSAFPTPRLQEFLQLVKLVNGVPYLEVPVTFTTTDAANLIEFLESTNIQSGYGQKRAALGQAAPWVGPTGALPEIYLSFCNECWNGATAGQDIPYRSGTSTYYFDYAQRAGSIFAAMRADSAFLPAATHLGFDMQLGVTYQLSVDVANMAAKSGAPDFVEQAPYTQTTVSNWQTDSALWSSAMEEPFGNATDPASSSKYYQGVTAIQAIKTCGPSGNAACIAANYEQANSSLATCGVAGNPACSGGANSAMDQPHEDEITAGAGEGIIAPLQALLNQQLLGVNMQNYFALAEYSNNTLYSNKAKLWSLTVDMGGATSLLNSSTFGGNYTPRPQMLGLMLANKAIIGPMFSCPISSNVTYNWAGDSVNGPTHALSSVPNIYAFCYKNSSTTRAMVLINTDLTTAHSVSFAGTNPPSGTVNLNVFAPSSLDALNEAATGTATNNTAAALSNTFSVLSSPASYSLPAHSVSTLTWSTTAVSGPRTVYVSNSGSDSNNGLSSSTPWQTVAQVNSQSFNPGDTILFQSGGVWREQLNIGASGSSTAPITYGSYGSGAQPMITGGNLVTWTNVSGNIWSTPQTANPWFPNFSGTPGVQESSQPALTAANEWYWDGSSTLYVYSTTNPAATVEIPTRSYAVYSNSGVNYVTLQNLEMRAAQVYGFQCYAAAAGCSNWMLNGVTVDLNYSNGAYILTGTAGTQSTNGLAQNSTFMKNGASGFKMGGYWASWNITGNQIYQNCLQPGSGSENTFCGGIYLYSGSGTDGTGSTISGNTVYNNGLASQANPNFGQGIWTDTTAGVTISNNTAYGNESNGIYLEKTSNGVAYHNIGYGNGGVSLTGCLTLAAGQTHNSTGNLVYANTCSGGYWTLGLNFEDANGSMSNNTVANNIFINSSHPVLYGAQYVNDGTHGSGNVLNKNSFGVASSNFTCWANACQSTYAALESAYGGTTNSLQVAPALVNPAVNNYNLKPTSPARNFGITYPGYTVPCGTPDLGAVPFPSLCSSSTYATEGQSATLTASVPSTWALCSGCVGSLSTAGPSTSVVYTAPASVVASNDKGGCQVFPADTIWNADISAAPVNSNSAAWLAGWAAAVASGTVTTEFDTWATSLADASTATRSFKTVAATTTLSGVPYPAAYKLNRQGGNLLGPLSNGSAHAHSAIVRTSDCTMYELYNDTRNNVTESCGDGTTGCNVQAAATYNGTQYAALSSGTNAAATPILSVWDIKAIANNNLSSPTLFVAPSTAFQGGVIQWPAQATAGGCTSGCSTLMPMGAMFRVKSSVTDASVCGASAPISIYCTTIVEGLKHHGMILSDTASSSQLNIYFARDITQDPNVLAAVQMVNGLPFSDFEAVDVSSYQYAAGSYQLCPSGQSCLSGVNSTLTPKNQAIVTATAPGGINSISTALQGMAIGLGVPAHVTMATGSYSWTIPAWVTGNSNTGILWTLTSGAGSVTTAGVYTPPSTGTGNAVLTATATADSNVQTVLTVNLVAQGANPAGTLRVDVGSSVNTSDGTNTWLADIGGEGGAHPISSGSVDSPAWSTSDPARLVYETGSASAGDTGITMVVPNGNYKVRVMMGQRSNSQCNSGCATWPGPYQVANYAPWQIETQGTAKFSALDVHYADGYLYQTPADVLVPAQVTDNVLRVYVRAIENDAAPQYHTAASGAVKLSYMDGIAASPDTTTSHWTIDTNWSAAGTPQNTIASGQTLQPFYVTDWYTGDSDVTAPTWSLVCAPNGITINSTTGVLTAAAGTYFGHEPVTIMAQGVNHSATATIYTVAAATPLR